MDTEGRRNVLKETLSELIMVEMKLEQIVTQNKLKTIAEESMEENDEYQDNINKSMEVFRRYNQKRGKK